MNLVCSLSSKVRVAFFFMIMDSPFLRLRNSCWCYAIWPIALQNNLFALCCSKWMEIVRWIAFRVSHSFLNIRNQTSFLNYCILTPWIWCSVYKKSILSQHNQKLVSICEHEHRRFRVIWISYTLHILWWHLKHSTAHSDIASSTIKLKKIERLMLMETPPMNKNVNKKKYMDSNKMLVSIFSCMG